MESIRALQQEIIDDLRAGTIKLPSIPNVMFRICEALTKRSCVKS